MLFILREKNIFMFLHDAVETVIPTLKRIVCVCCNINDLLHSVLFYPNKL